MKSRPRHGAGFSLYGCCVRIGYEHKGDYSRTMVLLTSFQLRTLTVAAT